MRDIILEKAKTLTELEFYNWLYHFVEKNDIFYANLNKSWNESQHRYDVHYNTNHLINDETCERYFYLDKKLSKYTVNEKIKVSKESDKIFVNDVQKLALEIKPKGGFLFIINEGLFQPTTFQYASLDEINFKTL